MIKAVALLARKPTLSREQFIEHYEQVHAPLVARSFPQIRKYRRNFIDPSHVIAASGETAPTFDVITEMWFDDKKGYEQMLAAHADPAVGGPVAEDADRLLDMSKTIQFLVHVHDTSPLAD